MAVSHAFAYRVTAIGTTGVVDAKQYICNVQSRFRDGPRASKRLRGT